MKKSVMLDITLLTEGHIKELEVAPGGQGTLPLSRKDPSFGEIFYYRRRAVKSTIKYAVPSRSDDLLDFKVGQVLQK